MGLDIDVRVLGPLQVWASGRRLDAGSAKQRALLTLLADRAPAVVSDETIVEQLWPIDRRQSRSQVRHSLWQLVSRIRRLLAEAGAPGCLPRSGDGYQLAMPRERIDVHRFGQYLDRARALAAGQDHEQVVTLLTEAMSWWGEPVLADLRTDWADRRRLQLTNTLLLMAHTTLFDAQLALGDHHTVLTRIPDLLERHDTDEHLAGQMMRALAGTGRVGELARFHASFQRHLVQQLGTDPSAELDALYQRLTSSLDAPRMDAGLGADSTPVPRQVPAPLPDLPGRDQQLADLDRLAAERAVSGGIVVVAGMPGVGKTSLAQYWAHHHADQFPAGQLYLRVHGHGPQPVDPGAGLAAMLDALGLAGDRVPSSVDQRRQRLADLLAHRRLLVVLDDVADTTQARALTVRVPGCLFLLTSRQRLQPLVVEDGAALVQVPPLDTEDSLTILRHLVGDSQTSDPALRYAAQVSGGLPLGVRIVGCHLAQRPHIPVGDQLADLPTQLMTPGDDESITVRDTIALSDQQLPDTARALWYRLGLHPGPDIDIGAAAALADTDLTPARRILAILTDRHLVTPAASDRIGLHDLIRRYLTDRLAETQEPGQIRAAQRRLLDDYLATVVQAAQLVAPHESLVPDLPDVRPRQEFTTAEQALDWCTAQRATLLALTRYAADHDFGRHAWQLAGSLSGLLDRSGPRTDLLTAHGIAVTAATRDDHPDGAAGSLNNLGAVHHALGHHQIAALCFTHALDLARATGNPESIASCQVNLAGTQLDGGDIDAAIAGYKDVLTAARTHHTSALEAHCLHKLGIAHRRRSNRQQAELYLHAALALRRELGAIREQAITLAEMASLSVDSGDLTPALRHATDALDAHQRAGDDISEADTRQILARIHLRLGNHAAALDHARRALDLTTRNNDSRRRASALEAVADALAAAGHQRDATLAHHQAHRIRRDLELALPAATDLPDILHQPPHAS